MTSVGIFLLFFCSFLLFPLQDLYSLKLGDVFFQSGSFELDSDAQDVLDRNISILKKNRKTRFILEGYSDKRGKKQYNKKLARNRVEAVIKYLIKRGIEPGRIKSRIIVGSTDKFAPGDSKESLQLNRRVRFVLFEEAQTDNSASISKTISFSTSDVDSNEKIKFDQLQEPITSQPIVEKDLLNIRRGIARYIEYKVPQDMTAGVGSVVIAEVRETLFDYLNDLKFSDVEPNVSQARVRVYLKGDGFDIANIDVPTGTSRPNIMIYAWNVIPMRSGVQTLILGIELESDVNSLYVPIYERVVRVYPFYMGLLTMGLDNNIWFFVVISVAFICLLSVFFLYKRSMSSG